MQSQSLNTSFSHNNDIILNHVVDVVYDDSALNHFMHRTLSSSATAIFSEETTSPSPSSMINAQGTTIPSLSPDKDQSLPSLFASLQLLPPALFQEFPSLYTTLTQQHSTQKGGDFLNLHGCDMVIVPSLPLSPYELENYTSVHYLEERSLCYSLLLTDPTSRMFFITSREVDSAIVNYYVSLLEGLGAKDVKSRLIMVPLYDTSTLKLATKVLSYDTLINDIKANIGDKNSAFICVQSNFEEQYLASKLGITKYLGNNPDLDRWGTKFGSRSLFAEAGVQFAPGTPMVYCAEDLIEKISEIVRDDASFLKIMVKLDKSFNGEGNAILDLRPIAGNINTSTIMTQLRRMKFSKPTETWETYHRKMRSIGAIAEKYLENEYSAPSFIGFISDDGTVHRLGTQNQILVGLEYMGCIFPADDEYRVRVQERGYRIGLALANKGAKGHFGVDFMVCKNPNNCELDIYAVEINLRHTGSTYPFMYAKLLTEGTLEPDTGLLRSSKNQYKYYISSSYVKNENYTKLTPGKVLEILAAQKLLFDSETQTGVVFQMLGSITEFGKFGMVCIANTHEDAAAMTAEVKATLDQAAQTI